MTNVALDAALSTAAESVGDVIATMEAIARALPPRDGVARFNQLYLSMTREVESAIAGVAFEDVEFMQRLDVVFAELYFEALRREQRRAGSAPAPWAALFEARARAHVHPLAFAVCGMNAHINYDLAHALVRATESMGGSLSPGTPRHRDFVAINKVLAAAEPKVKAGFVDGVLREVDNAFGSADDRAALWSIARARDASWIHAMALSAMPAVFLRQSLSDTLARSFGLVGRALVL